MNANEIFLKEVLQATGDPDLAQAMAQLHTATWWLLNGVAVVDRERVNEAQAAIYGN